MPAQFVPARPDARHDRPGGLALDHHGHDGRGCAGPRGQHLRTAGPGVRSLAADGAQGDLARGVELEINLSCAAGQAAARRLDRRLQERPRGEERLGAGVSRESGVDGGEDVEGCRYRPLPLDVHADGPAAGRPEQQQALRTRPVDVQLRVVRQIRLAARQARDAKLRRRNAQPLPQELTHGQPGTQETACRELVRELGSAPPLRLRQRSLPCLGRLVRVQVHQPRPHVPAPFLQAEHLCP
ncbi:hypothetical protein OHA64_26465 [Streptomyces sp. NBC_00076]